MTARSAEREGQVGRTPARAAMRRLLTPEEREMVAARVRELKRVAIPRLQRIMQSPDPDPTDRESYHRATNELDWLLEIVEHTARLDRISRPSHRLLRGHITTKDKGGSGESYSGGISEKQDPGARLMPTTGREERDGTR